MYRMSVTGEEAIGCSIGGNKLLTEGFTLAAGAAFEVEDMTWCFQNRFVLRIIFANSQKQMELDKESFKTLVEQHDTFLFDCDGVIWRGSKPIEGSIEFLKILRKLVS